MAIDIMVYIYNANISKILYIHTKVPNADVCWILFCHTIYMWYIHPSTKQITCIFQTHKSTWYNPSIFIGFTLDIRYVLVVISCKFNPNHIYSFLSGTRQNCRKKEIQKSNLGFIDAGATIHYIIHPVLNTNQYLKKSLVKVITNLNLLKISTKCKNSLRSKCICRVHLHNADAKVGPKGAQPLPGPALLIRMPSSARGGSSPYLGPLLLTWINFDLSMDELSHVQLSVGWHYLSIPKLQRLDRWSLGMDK